jgi:molybdopterin converting factor small subunit
VITVRMRTVGLLKSLLKRGDLEVELADGATVADLLAALAAEGGPEVASHLEAPVRPDAHPPLRVQVNGRDIEVLDGRLTALADGDDVLVLTPIAGG